MTVFLSGWHLWMEFSQIRLCLIAADKLQEPLIPRRQQEDLAEILGVQQEGQNFEDLPLTKETIVTASHSSSNPGEPALGTLSFLWTAPSCSITAGYGMSFLVLSVDSFSRPPPPMSLVL